MAAAPAAFGLDLMHRGTGAEIGVILHHRTERGLFHIITLRGLFPRPVDAERDARIARAQGEAQAIFLSKKAEADGIRELLNAKIDDRVLELKRFEAMVKVADGHSAKIIIPTDMVSSVKNSVIFAETAGLGDVTASREKEPDSAYIDPCCDDDQIVLPGSIK